jgi:hypothetical protein
LVNLRSAIRNHWNYFSQLLTRLWSSVKENKAKVISMGGLLLVFVTFVIKDILRERAKDALEESIIITNAFGIRQDIAELTQKVAIIERTVSAIGRDVNEISNLKALAEYDNSTAILISELWNWSEEDAASLRAIEDALEHDSKNEKTYKELLRLKDDFARESKTFNTLRGEGLAEKANQILAEKKLGSVTILSTKLKGKFSVLFANLGRVTEEIRELKKSALNETKVRLQTAETRYGTYTFISYFTYTLGWILAFAGEVLGRHTPSIG